MAHEELGMVHCTAGGTSVFKRITMIILLENVTTFPLELKRGHKTQGLVYKCLRTSPALCLKRMKL